jgi:hypothetical protein
VQTPHPYRQAPKQWTLEAFGRWLSTQDKQEELNGCRYVAFALSEQVPTERVEQIVRLATAFVDDLRPVALAAKHSPADQELPGVGEPL